MIPFLVLVGLAALGLGAVVVAAGHLCNRRGWSSFAAVVAVALALVLVIVAVWATLAVSDDVDASASTTTVAAPPSAGIAGNGNCPPECLADIYSRSIGARAAVYLLTR